MKEISNKQEWKKIVGCKDFAFYQSFEWGELKADEGWEVRRYFEDDSRGDYCLAQCFYKKMLGITIVWVPGGPLISDDSAISILSVFLDKLSDDTAKKSKFYYIRLNCQTQSSPELSIVFKEKGYAIPYKNIATNYTFMVDEHYFEDINCNLSKNWKRNLKRSYKSGFDISIKITLDDLDEIFSIYDELVIFKKLNKTKSIRQIESLYKKCDNMIVTFLAYKNSHFFSGRIIFLYGNKAFDFLAATTLEGRKNYASYFLIYEMLKWCGKNNISSFDFSGVDPKDAKGVYNFKKGTGSRLVEYIGERDKASSPLVKILFNLGLYFKGFGKD